MPDIDKMTKDELADYASENFDVELNKRNTLNVLKKQVEELVGADKEQTSIGDVPDSPEVEYLLNPKTGYVLKCTKHLMLNEDLVPCDEDGNRL